MDRSELRAQGMRLLIEARAIRAAYPDLNAMGALRVSDVRMESFGGDKGSETFWVALGHLREEMVLVGKGKSDTLAVLDDEIANVERLLLHL